MLINKIRKITLLLLFAISCTSVFAAGEDLTERFLNKANEAFEDGNIEDAYKYINQALTLNKSDAEAANILFFAQSIYVQKLEGLKEKYDELDFIDVTENLSRFPNVQNTKITKLIKQVESIQKEKEKLAEQESEMAWRETQKEALKAQTEALEESNKAAAEQNEALKNALADGLKDMKESSQAQTQAIIDANEGTKGAINKVVAIVIVIVVLIFFIVLVIMLIARRGFKNQEMQQQQYVQAFKMLAASQNQTNRIMLGGITDLYGQNPTMRIAGSSRWAPQALPNIEQTEEEKAELAELASKCEKLGREIDQVTGRKNNSKNVSELVYKLAIQLGLPQGESMLYFCASMIYDAGFLGLKPELLTKDQLTPDEKRTIQTHVSLADKYLDFVPKKYWDTFDNAAKFHHENMDGSGYPNKQKGEKIPQIARIIRVAESFISMSSKRDYRQIMDKETAIEKLRENPDIYDQDVVDILEQII